MRPIALAASVLTLVAGTSAALADGPTRISLASDGTQAEGSSHGASLSANARFVLFYSYAKNLVEGDTNAEADVFLHDRDTGRTKRVSIASDDQQGNGRSAHAAAAPGGRYFVFSSVATNLVAGDTNGEEDVFVRDRVEQRTFRASVRTGGQQGNAYSWKPHAAGDGNLVVFQSKASNLVPNDTNGALDVFLRDLRLGTTVRLSVSSNGTEGNGPSTSPRISGDGKIVVFSSEAGNLVANDTNGKEDVFVRDLAAGTTVRVSLSSAGVQANGLSHEGSLNHDGRRITFSSVASNLVPNDTNGQFDLYAHDRVTGRTTRLNVGPGGQQANDGVVGPASLSNNGRFVVFGSLASNLVAGDTNQAGDVFLHDRQTNTIQRLSVSAGGAQGDNSSRSPAISGDGTRIAFESQATNLVPNDTNQRWDVFVSSNPFLAPPATAWPWDSVPLPLGSGLAPLPLLRLPVPSTVLAEG